MSDLPYYLNPKQREFLSNPSPYRCLIASRSFGKGVVIAWSIVEKLITLTRRTPQIFDQEEEEVISGAKGLLTCLTLKQLKNKTIPNMQKIWGMLGMERDLDYWCFKMPPDEVIEKMIAPPNAWKDVISFSNGLHLECVSPKQYDSARGGSYDFIEGDEMCFFPEDFFTSVIIPSRRGNKEYFTSHTHHQISLYSSMSHTLEGMWVVHKMEKLHQENPAVYFYMEATIEDNIEVYTRENLENDRRLIPYLKFMIEFYNFRVQQAENMFYFKFDEQRHLYGTADETSRDIHYSSKKPIDISVDLGGWYSCMGLFQESNNTEYQFDHYDAIKKESIYDLVDKMCDAYRSHQNKLVRIYGDPRGHDETMMGQTAYQMIAARFRERGWTVDIRVSNTTMQQHQWRYNIMNDILDETNPQYPKLRFHREKCKDTIVSFHMTESTNEFKKNKAKERDREFPQQHAPHNTDLVDYLIIQKHGWKLGLVSSIMSHSTAM